MAKIHTPIPALKLNDGTSIPMLGFGAGTAWYKKGDKTKQDLDLVEKVKIALDMGFNMVDAAESYSTEAELGQAFKDAGIERDKLYITTKVEENMQDIPGAIQKSLKALQVDYVDLYLIHNPFWACTGPNGTGVDEAALQKVWAEMEKVKEAGLAKSIGVSNFLIQHLTPILATAKIPPAVNQIEFHPYLQHAALLDFHKQHGIATEAYAPLTPIVRAQGGPVDEYLSVLAKKYAVSEGEILLRWCIDQDIVALTTSGKEQRLSDMLRATRFKLTPVEIKEICELGAQKHFRGFRTKVFAEDCRD